MLTYTEHDIQSKQEQRTAMTIRQRTARVISITSGKGGVGKTNTTVNLGLALVKLGRKVLILDADLGLANVNILLGFQPAATLQEVLQGKAALRDVIVSHSSGLDIIPAASGIPELVELSTEEKLALMQAFDDFAFDYDYLIIDTAAGIGSNVLYFNVAAERVVVIIDQEPTSITDAYALIKVLATKWDTKFFDIVVNRTPESSAGKTIFAKLSRASDRFLPAQLNYLGSIAADDSISEAVVRQTPLLDLFPSTCASRDFMRLARKVEANDSERRAKGGLQFFFRSLLER